jgi:hypothetical protein
VLTWLNMVPPLLLPDRRENWSSLNQRTAT